MNSELLNQIIERLQNCADEALLDLIYKLLLESGY